MSTFLVEALDGLQKKNGVQAVLVDTNSSAIAQDVARGRFEGDADWGTPTLVTVGASSLMAADYRNCRYRVTIRGAGGSGIEHEAEYTGIAGDTVTLIAAELANRLSGKAMKAALQDDGGSFTDETDAANNSTASDMNFTPAAPAAGDAYLFGLDVTFGKLAISVGTPGTGTYTMAWEYWNGTAWVALAGVTDGTGSFKNSGKNRVTFTVPTAWAKAAFGNSASLFFVRAKIDGGTVTAAPKGTRAWAGPGTLASSSTNTLTASQTSDNLGDRVLEVDAFMPGAEKASNAAFVGLITDEGAAGAALTVALNDLAIIPTVIREFGLRRN